MNRKTTRFMILVSIISISLVVLSGAVQGQPVQPAGANAQVSPSAQLIQGQVNPNGILWFISYSISHCLILARCQHGSQESAQQLQQR